MEEFSNDSQKVLAKAQELMDKKSHSYLGVVHLAYGLLEAPDARLKNLYRAKKANIKEMEGKLAPFIDSVPKLVEVNGTVKSLLYEIQNGDQICTFDYYSVTGLLEFADIDTSTAILLNGLEAGAAAKIHSGDVITLRPDPIVKEEEEGE